MFSKRYGTTDFVIFTLRITEGFVIFITGSMSFSWIPEYLVISSLTGMEHTGHIHKKHEEQTNTRRPGYSI
jgi:hypothetical protein